ncbi:MAG: hypothetical protein K8Q99_04625 [Acholeplasmataceae bacterium]|nr:hypothetical protein [Acholeplasmataceae bacterium]
MANLGKRYKYLVLSIIFVFLTILGTVTYSWFVLINRTDSFIATAAKIDISYTIYLDGILLEPEEFSIDTGTSVMTKTGIYSINVTDFEAENYIDNLRIDIHVNSTVNTYLRVSIIDALTLSTVDFEGNKGEVSIVDQPINYAFSREWDVNGTLYDDLVDAEIALGGITSNDTVTKINHWFDNKLNDGYYYYPQVIERDMDSQTLNLSFIEEYDGDEFDTKSFGYTLQFALLVEAIQAGNSAPIYNWGLPNAPWGGSW